MMDAGRAAYLPTPEEALGGKRMRGCVSGESTSVEG